MSYSKISDRARLKSFNDLKSLTWFEALVVTKIAVTSLIVHAEGRKNESIYERTS